MNIEAIVALFHGWLFILAAFAIALGIAMFRGRQTLINLTIGAYLGLLLFTQFPYLEDIVGKAYGSKSGSILTLFVFIVFTVISAWLFARLMPREFLEGPFESMGKKILLAAVATVVVLTLSTHYLPVAEMIDISAPLPDSLTAEEFSFAWLLLPLIALFILA